MKTTRRMMFSAVALSLAITGSLMAQRMKSGENAQSPAQKTETIVGKAKITVDYSAPSLRGRKVGEQVAPYGKVWRTGADAATTLITSAPLSFGSLDVPAGAYSLYTLPSATGWQLIISKQTGQWGTEYSENQDLGRVPMKVAKLSSPQEQMKIDVKWTGGNKGELHVMWGNVDASAPFTAKQ